MEPQAVSLIVDAVVAGATAGLHGTAAEAVMDSYAALTALLARRRVDILSLEREPDSTSARDALWIDLRELAPNAIDDEVLTTARRLVRAISAHGDARRADELSGQATAERNSAGTVGAGATRPAAAGEPVGRVFLSYRRTDAPHAAGRLFEHFTHRFGVGNVFMDVDSIDAGLDFVETIEAAVGSCDVLVAVIGRDWLGAVDERGRRRLEDPHDFVALEITTALQRGVRVIPVLVDGTRFLQSDDLPNALAPLARRQSVRLDHATWGAGITTLITAVQRALSERATPAAGVPQGPTGEQSGGTREAGLSGVPKPAPAPAPSGLEEKIDRAIRARVGQRPVVDQLGAAWTELSRGFFAIVLAAEDISQPRSTTTADPGDRARAAIAAVLTCEGDAPALTRQLRDRTRNVEGLIDAVRARVRRDTVNIGVIGSTKAGKSTLLRTITGLPDTVVPTMRFNPTTAVVTRIFHTKDRATGFLRLHTWESFRDTYLAPLHQGANLGPPPRRPDDFRSHRYPAPGSATASPVSDDFLRRLHSAQSSFASYEYLLTGSARTLEVELATLRPYVAYPDSADSANIRPYHAVRDVCIKQCFPDVAAIGLIDLPGAGEAGLDIDRHFVQRAKNEIDFLLLVKRGGTVSSAYLAEDSYALRLADSMRGGAALEDFLAVVVNRDERHDPTGEYFANTLAEMRAAVRDRRITVFATDVTSHEDVTADLLRPVFDHLAATLARMDRANTDAVLLEAGQTATAIARFAEDLAGHAERQLSLLPDQEYAFRDLVRGLHRSLAFSLYTLRDQYDRLVALGTADEPLTRGIRVAVQAASTWVDNGFGAGDREAWFAEIEGPWKVGNREAAQEQYYRVKTQMTKYFADVDASLEHSIHELWNRVADILRSHLTAELVPAAPTGREALEHLRDHAAHLGMPVIREALDRLVRLKAAFGSLVLRVTGPIIRQIDPAEAGASARGDGSRAVRAAAVDVLTDGGPTPSSDVADPPAAPRIQGLYDELTTTTHDTIDQLEMKLTEEAQMATGVLAQAIDAFFDSIIRTNNVEWEYESICGPYRREIWPDEFTGGIPGLAAELSDLQKQAQLLIAASTLDDRWGPPPQLR